VKGITYLVIVSARDKNGKRLLDNLKTTLVYAICIMCFISILISWFYSNVTVRPVNNIIAAARAINASNLSRRVPKPRGKGEIVSLAETINTFLDELEDSFKMQRDFVANASHQLRTPITSMLGSLEVVLMQPRSNDEYKAAIESVLEDTKRMRSLVNTLLIYAQANSSAFNKNLKHIRIDEVIMEARTNILKLYPGRIIQLYFSEEISDENDLIISGNEKLINQALINLIENALKYSSADKEICIRISGDDKFVTVEVCNHGSGIRSEDLKHIFEPFYRSGTNENVHGFGLGLPIARQIAESHGGSLDITSEEGKGTIATITFPKTK
jgi:signal transduction histidine kinase